MSIAYAVAVVSILKWTVSPLFTLMSVPKPWIDGSPSPSMSHSLFGLPTSVFSHTIGFSIGTSHGPTASAGVDDLIWNPIPRPRPSPIAIVSSPAVTLRNFVAGGAPACARHRRRRDAA